MDANAEVCAHNLTTKIDCVTPPNGFQKWTRTVSTDLSVEQLVSRIRKLAKGRSEAQILTTQMDCVTPWDASPKWAQTLSTNLNAEQLVSRIRKLAKGRSEAQILTR